MSSLRNRSSLVALLGSILLVIAPTAPAGAHAAPSSDGAPSRIGSSAGGGVVHVLNVDGIGVGLIPDGPGTPTVCGSPGAPLDISFTLPQLRGELVDLDIELEFSPVHTWGGDVTAVLFSPDGLRQHTLFGRIGATSAAACGSGKRLGGPYVFSDAATPPSGGLWQAAQAPGGDEIPAGSYFTTNSGGAGAVSPMPPTSLAATFAGMPPAQMQGTWTLRLTDGGQGDPGGVGAATLRIHYRGDEIAIYDNGPLATGSTTQSGVVAPAGYLWSELQMDASAPGVANGTAGFCVGDTGSVKCRLADDFIVPEGQVWTLTHADFAAYSTGHGGPSAPFEFLSLRIWDGPPSAPGSQVLCGDEITNVYQMGYEMGLLRAFNSVVVTAPDSSRRIWAMRAVVPAACAGAGFFNAGTYWLDWSSRIAGNVGHYAPSVTIPGIRSRPGDNALQWIGSGAWTAMKDEGTPATPPAVPVALPFTLYGRHHGAEIFADGFE